MTIPERPRPWWLPPRGRVHFAWWIAVAALMLWIEYITGTYTGFPVAYVIPVSLAAWYSGRWPAVTLAVAVPIVHLVFIVVSGAEPGTLALLVPLTAFRGAAIMFLALWFARLSEHERELSREVLALQGLLSICSICKSIRNDAGEWERLERYISRRSETQFSHGLCPACLETIYPGMSETEPKEEVRN